MAKFQVMDRTVGYSVREIMTPSEALECWTGNDAERSTLAEKAEYFDYTYIPVKKGRVIQGFITVDQLHKKDDYKAITQDWLLASDTTILELIDLFAKQKQDDKRIFFVLQTSKIVGLVSPADLNHIAARASVYLLVAHFEMSLVKLIQNVLKGDEKRYTPYISPKHLKDANSLRQKTKEFGIGLDLLNYVYLSDLCDIVAKIEELRQIFNFADEETAKKQLNFKLVRNPISHTSNVFIDTRKKIVEVNDACKRLIQYGKLINRYIARSTT